MILEGITNLIDSDYEAIVIAFTIPSAFDNLPQSLTCWPAFWMI